MLYVAGRLGEEDEFDFFGAFYDIPHLRFGNEFDIGMKAKMSM